MCQLRWNLNNIFYTRIWFKKKISAHKMAAILSRFQCVITLLIYHEHNLTPYRSKEILLKFISFRSRIFPVDSTDIYIQKISWFRPRVLSPARNKLRPRSASHRAGSFSNLACDWLSIIWAYSEQETGNGIGRPASYPWNCLESARDFC